MPAFQFSGAKLRTARKTAGLSPTQLAYQIGRSEQLVKLWELGYRQPPADKLVETAKVLGVDVAAFFVESDEVPV